MTDPSPTPPVPVTVVNTVDVSRDLLEFLVNVGGIVGSLLMAGAALWLAKRANDHAVEANRLAKDAERKSREFVVAERRRTFELEILRDLAEAVDRICQDADLLHGARAAAARRPPAMAPLGRGKARLQP